MIPIIEILLLLTVFLIPLIGANSQFGYEQIKVLFFLLLTSINGFLWMFTKPKFKLSTIQNIAASFICILALASILGLNPAFSFLGTEPYYQGWILYAYLFLFFLMVSQLAVEFKYWAIIISVSSFLVAILAIKDWFLLNFLHTPVPNYAGRIVSSFGQPNFYAGFVLLSLPLTYYLLVKTKARLKLYLIYFVLLLEVFAIVVSESRTAFLLLFFLVFIWLQSKIKKHFFLISLITVITIIFSILFANHFSSGILSGQVLNLKLSDNPDLTHQSVEKRPYMWLVATELIKQKPITGYGLENINKAFSTYFQVNKHKLFEENLKVSPVLISLKDLNIDRTHNYILDLLLFSGVLGLIGWSVLVFLVIRKVLISKVSLENSVLLVGLVIYLIWIQFQNQSIAHLIYFWLLLGLIDKKTIDNKS